MFLSKQKNGFYYLYFQDTDGKRKKVSTKATLKSKALDFLSRFHEELRRKAEQNVLPISLEKFRFELLKHSESIHSARTTADFKTTFNGLVNQFGDIQLSSLSRTNIETYIERRIRNTSVYAARKDIAYISSALEFAVSRGYLLENPSRGIRKPKLPEKQPLFFSREELTILISVIEEKSIRDLVGFAVNTGARQSELLNLRWSQIDFVRKRLELNNRNYLTKSKKIRSIPLNKVAAEILISRKEKTKSEFVFTLNGVPIKQNFLVKRFKKYVKKAHLNPELTFHSLRHTFASWLVMKGVSLYEVQRLLGHSSPSVTQIYAHLTNDTLSNAVEKLSEPSN